MQRLARTVARAGVSPNQISILGMLAAVAAGVLLAAAWHDRLAMPDLLSRGMLVVVALLIQLRLVCNLIDGMVAIEGGKRSAIGELFNEVPDRVSDAAVLIGAGFAVTGSPTLGYLAALAAVLTAYIRAVGKGAGVGSDFGGPMDKKVRMLTVAAAALYLAFTPRSFWPEVELQGHAFGLLSIVLLIITLGSLLTCILRLRRIARRMQSAGVTG